METKTVEKIKKQTEHILRMENSLVQTKKALVFLNESDDNYYGCISKHMDGSGWTINLNGCFIADSILEYTIKLLEKNVENEKNTLKKMIK